MATQLTSKHYVAPPLPEVELDTIPKLFFHAIDDFARPDAMMYREGEQWRSISHAEVEERVSDLAAALSGMGVQKGDRVALLSENRPEWAISDFAILCVGAVNVPIYATLPPNQIAYILNDSGAKVALVSTAEQLDKILEIRDQVESLQHVVAFDVRREDAGVEQLSDLYARGKEAVGGGTAEPLRVRARSVERDDLASLVYTSGTTGKPKGVMLTHFNFASNVAATDEHKVFAIRKGDVALSFLPISHVFERMVDYYYWGHGAGIAYVADLNLIGQSMLEVRPHVLAAAPRVFEKIYTRVMGAGGIKKLLVLWAKRVGEAAVDDRLSGRAEGPTTLQQKLTDRLVFAKLRARTGGRIRAFISGSAPLSPDIIRFFWAAGLPIYEGYGLTETSPVVSANRPGAVRIGTVGQVFPGTEVAIDATGEILVKGPQVMRGYWNDTEATAAVIDADGWLHTGDIGELDSDGFLRITDRLKNIIVTAGGKNIAPQPIENLVALSPHIAQVVMLGDKRPYPTLLVAPDFENLRAWASDQGIDTGDQERLVSHPRVVKLIEEEVFSRLGTLARYEMPKKIAIIPHEFTVEDGQLTPSMKVRRSVVEERYRDRIEEMYG